MARLLYRLAAFCAAHRWQVATGWVVVLLLASAMAASGLSFAAGAFEIPGTDSARAQRALQREFPSTGTAKQEQLQLVFRVPTGAITDQAPAAAVATALEAARQVEHVVKVSDPLAATPRTVSPDGQVAIATVTLQGLNDDEALEEHAAAELERVAAGARAAGLTAEVGGTLVQQKPSQIGGPSELAGVVIAFLVLVLTFGSLAAAGINMLVAILSVAVGSVTVLAASAIHPIQASTPILAVMLGLAVGIDYALFILSRFRDELRAGRGVGEAVPLAIGTAGSAVVFAGLTVIIALAGLAVVNIPFITEMGVAAAAAIAIAVLIALTLMPVVLRTLGRRALAARERHAAPHVEQAPTPRIGFFERWAAVVTRRPVASLVAAVVLLAILASPVRALHTALSTPGGADPESAQRRAYTLVAEHFGAGYQSPLIVLVQGSDATAQGAAIAQTITTLGNVAVVSPPQPNAGNTAAILSVIATAGPNDDATADLVQAIRSAPHPAGATVSVTGSTAVDIDVNAKLSDALVKYLILIVGLAMVLLMVLFRSLLVPVVAALGFLLSLAASFGITVAMFQWGWAAPLFGVKEGAPILSLLPIIIVGILFGLAMDYQVFLVSRIHGAHTRGLSTTEAIRDGFGRSAGIVAAAATIMAAVFFGFGFSGGSALVASLAVALATGVLLDAFVVRMIVIPATLTLFGTASWWLPSWLDRLLPTIDTEGKSLESNGSVGGTGSHEAPGRGATIPVALGDD
jgi:RND superfamily putative drug exporter